MIFFKIYVSTNFYTLECTHILLVMYFIMIIPMDFLKHFVFDEIFVRDLYYLYNICVIIRLSYMKYVNIKVE